jgi:hypothetical protein
MDVFQENLIDVKTGHFQEKVALEILVWSQQGLSFPWMMMWWLCYHLAQHFVWQNLFCQCVNQDQIAYGWNWTWYSLLLLFHQQLRSWLIETRSHL